MDSAIINRINEEIDIVALASEFVALTKRGKNFMGLCPFHSEKTPSFSVSPEKHLAKCMGCGQGGTAIAFFSQVKNISFDDAAVELAGRLGIEVKTTKKIKDPNESSYQLMEEANRFYQFALKNTDAGLEAYEYLKNRGLKDEEIEHFGIGFAPGSSDALFQMLKSKQFSVTDMMKLGLVKQSEQGDYYDVFRSRITFPVDNLIGRIVGFSARSLNPKEIAKYVNSTETKIFKKGELVYHYQPSLRPAVTQKSVILHEGFFDVIASYKAGLKAAVATMGTALTKDQAQAIKRISQHVIIAYDGDKAGINATLKAIQILANQVQRVSVLSLPASLDPDDYIKKFGIEAYQKLFETSVMDPYQFGYEYHKSNKDFNKAADITVFKQNMIALLSTADKTIQEFYQRKVFDEIGIHLFIIQSQHNLPVKDKPLPKPIISRAVRAEILLIVSLLVSNEHLDEIRTRLDMTNLTKMEHYELLNDIYKYYDHFKGDNHINIELFVKTYEKHQALLEKDFLEHVYYIKKLPIKSDELDDILIKISTDTIEEEIKRLKKQLNDTTDYDVQARIAEQISKLQRKKN